MAPKTTSEFDWALCKNQGKYRQQARAAIAANAPWLASVASPWNLSAVCDHPRFSELVATYLAKNAHFDGDCDLIL